MRRAAQSAGQGKASSNGKPVTRNKANCAASTASCDGRFLRFGSSDRSGKHGTIGFGSRWSNFRQHPDFVGRIARGGDGLSQIPIRSDDRRLQRRGRRFATRRPIKRTRRKSLLGLLIQCQNLFHHGRGNLQRLRIGDGRRGRRAAPRLPPVARQSCTAVVAIAWPAVQHAMPAVLLVKRVARVVLPVVPLAALVARHELPGATREVMASPTVAPDRGRVGRLGCRTRRRCGGRLLWSPYRTRTALRRC